MKQFYLNTDELKSRAGELSAGDKVFLSGVAYTARDAAHKRIMQIIKENGQLPFEISGSVIYYCGPTGTKPGAVIGSCGPTTSSRMDPYTPTLLDLGLSGIIGKGQRNSEVIDAIKRNKAVYLCAVGGAGALASKCITSCEVIAFEDLGCESVKKLMLKDFPLTVGVDANGKSLFD